MKTAAAPMGKVRADVDHPWSSRGLDHEVAFDRGVLKMEFAAEIGQRASGRHAPMGGLGEDERGEFLGSAGFVVSERRGGAGREVCHGFGLYRVDDTTHAGTSPE